MTVPEHLREALHRRRRMGQGFDLAWRASVRVVTADLEPSERGVWRTILEGHRHEWQRAFEGRDLSAHAAAVASIEDLWTDEPADRGQLAAR